ncbi:AAA family ATPase [Myroides sp. BIT-d1]|uniref:AAA family ATPase n=1 Tax=Myroides albus TaxID=2562892 RepID=A0A6I3LRS5_9FLAO|nr:AAA domain-containing protein [Myroides albus]MTG98802.1 AAA family ATPase [Myroides albus]
MESKQFIVFLKNKTSLLFEYKSDVTSAVCIGDKYQITFRNGKTYKYGIDKVQYLPLLSTQANVRIYQKGILNTKYDTVHYYGDYFIFTKDKDSSNPIKNDTNIEICPSVQNSEHIKPIIDYFKDIITQSIETSFDVPINDKGNDSPQHISSNILQHAFNSIDILDSRSALTKYLNGYNPTIEIDKKKLIYPFGCNQSQKLAVQTSLNNSMTIIEGPPGTGKTQTILNIIANLIIEGKTIGIVSNNNSAIFNIQDKLQNYGYDFIMATLGNKENKSSFFNAIDKQTVNGNLKSSKNQLEKANKNIRELDSVITTCFKYRNELAILRSRLSEVTIEFSHVRNEQPLDCSVKEQLDKKFYRKWNCDQTLKIKNLLSTTDFSSKLSFYNKLRLVLQFGFIDLKNFHQYRTFLPIYINHKFYELYIVKLEQNILAIENWLTSNNETENLNSFIDSSKIIFNNFLSNKYNHLDQIAFTSNNYLKHFNDFIERYPIILSSTLSLHTSIPKGYLLDYLIIDEASQVDIIKSAVCFSCCRNVIIVGDSMQLTHIVDNKSKQIVEGLQKQYAILPAYDYINYNILNSLKSLFKSKIQSILLKEHYRCHPTIIGFCNKKYYNDELIVMTHNKNHPFRIIETNISGEWENSNQRQIDETNLYIQKNYSDFGKIGIVSPYRDHVTLLQKQLKCGVEADTIHKFQGREKEVIIFNTVKNKIIPFIDNPNLINVAVSRAIKEFIIVKPATMDLPHGTNIGDLIRYICYTTDPKETIIKGEICSVFDLLYKEYNKKYSSFISSNKHIQGSPAEKIIHHLLKNKILVNKNFEVIDMVREYRLKDLVSNINLFDEEETKFIMRDSKLDFLLFNKIDKSPVLAIEVDGVSFHENLIQKERDKKKDKILKTIGLSIIRLSTNSHSEEKRIIEKLKIAMGI